MQERVGWVVACEAASKPVECGYCCKKERTNSILVCILVFFLFVFSGGLGTLHF